MAPAAAGNILIVQVLADGTNASVPTVTSWTNAEDLAGTDTALTSIGRFNVGNPVAATQEILIGRSLSTSAPVITGANVGGDDVFVRMYEFTAGSTGTTLATVIENSTAGATANGTGAITQIDDTAVVTLGIDRLALNLIAVNDDVTGLNNVLFGATGGTWVQRADYADATGTDGALALQTAAMATAGTIDGGSLFTGTAGSWGNVGFALLPTGAAAPSDIHQMGFVNFSDPGVV
jgi:hypothetical protein